jgi:hypothetical protein
MVEIRGRQIQTHVFDFQSRLDGQCVQQMVLKRTFVLENSDLPKCGRQRFWLLRQRRVLLR